MPEGLAKAVQLHQSGQWEAADAAYRALLAVDQQNADALHLLGVLQHQRGGHVDAIRLIGMAVTLRPNVAAYHANLGEAYRAAGQIDRAAGCFHAALGLVPAFPEAMANLGLVCQAQGRPFAAETHFRRAIELNPQFAAAHNSLGVLLREMQRADEALTCFQAAVSANGQYAPALSNLGQLLSEHGDVTAGLGLCRQAVTLQPDNAAFHHNLGNALRLSGDAVAARGEYLEALRLNPELAESHAQLGRLLWSDGQATAAASWLRQAAQLEPDKSQHWTTLAELYDELEEYALSIPCWRRVLELTPGQPAALVSLGWAFQEEGDLRSAESCFHQALAARPDFVPALLNLGGLHEEHGDLLAAEARYRQALRVAPRSAAAFARLATLMRGRLTADERQLLERLCDDPQLSDSWRARVCFGLAHVADGQGDFAAAAQRLQQAHDLARTSSPRSRAYFPAEHERFVDQLITQFDAGFFARLSAQGSANQTPIFIFGLPRSGTTLLEQILASHSQVHAAGELQLARRTFEAIPRTLGLSVTPCEAVGQLDGAALRQLAQNHLQALTALADGKVRIVDKLPDNYLYLGLLATLFPKATFIHAQRDKRDVALSCWMTDFRSIRWTLEPAHIASRFQQYDRLMEHWNRALPATIHTFRYEDVVSEFEPQARRLVSACGLAWEPACLAPHQTRRPVRTASLTQVREPVHTRSVGRWQRYRPHLAELFSLLQG